MEGETLHDGAAVRAYVGAFMRLGHYVRSFLSLMECLVAYFFSLGRKIFLHCFSRFANDCRTDGNVYSEDYLSNYLALVQRFEVEVAAA